MRAFIFLALAVISVWKVCLAADKLAKEEIAFASFKKIAENYVGKDASDAVQRLKQESFTQVRIERA